MNIAALRLHQQLISNQTLHTPEPVAAAPDVRWMLSLTSPKNLSGGQMLEALVKGDVYMKMAWREKA